LINQVRQLKLAGWGPSAMVPAFAGTQIQAPAKAGTMAAL